jgi:hypothetical protein
MAVLKKAPYPEASIAIIVPYNTQQTLYFAVIKDLGIIGQFAIRKTFLCVSRGFYAGPRV